jgi:hypothetical protein
MVNCAVSSNVPIICGTVKLSLENEILCATVGVATMQLLYLQQIGDMSEYLNLINAYVFNKKYLHD